MAKPLDLKTDSITRLFFSYFLPAFCAMLALSTYATVDGIFVGHKVGENGLAAIGVCWAIFPTCFAYELLFGFGGAVIVSYFLGKGQTNRARLVFSSIVYFVLGSSIIMGVIGVIYAESIVRFLIGGKAISLEIFTFAVEYLRVIFIGISCIILHPLFDIFVMNDKRPTLAMIAMIIGSGSNIILNYIFLFVLDMGVEGSAIATVLAHGIGVVVLLSHFLRKRGELFFIPRFSFPACLTSAKSGVPESASELSAAIVMWLFNTRLLEIAGDRGVQIYSVLMYCGIVFFTILLAVSQALQPIASFNYGAGNMDRLRAVFRFSLMVAACMGALLYVLFYCFDGYLVSLFVQDNVNLARAITEAMSVYYLGYIVLGVNMVCAIFLQSIQRTLNSFIITMCYTFIFIALLLPPLSAHYGIDGAFASYPLAQICALVVAVLVMIYEVRYGVWSKNAPSGREMWKRKRHRL